MMDEIKRHSISECPKCGHDKFYTKSYASGIIRYIERFDGEEANNGDMYEGLSHKKQSKYAYCNGCNKRLFKGR